MHLNFPRKLVALLLVAAPLSFVYAAKTEVKEYSFDLSDIDKIDIHAAVGSVNVIRTSAKKVSVVLEIRQQNHHWFQRDIDLSEVELQHKVRGGSLSLSQKDDDLNIDWTIELPEVADTVIDLGVGKIEGKLGATKLNVHLGVGDVELTMPEEAVGDIDLSTGVGDANLRGGSSSRHKHSFVSQDVDGHGSGDNSVRIKVGVGQVELRLDHAAKL